MVTISKILKYSNLSIYILTSFNTRNTLFLNTNLLSFESQMALHAIHLIKNRLLKYFKDGWI